MHSRVVLLGYALLIASCSLDRVSITGEPGDAGREIDAGLVFDAGADAGPTDAAIAPDTGVDSGVVPEVDSGVDAGHDAGVDAGQDAGVDAGQDAGPSPLRTCVEIYGALRMYTECMQTETDCEFYVDYGSDTTCNALCDNAGGRCVRAYNDSGGRCSRGEEDPECDASLNAQICICRRVP